MSPETAEIIGRFLQDGPAILLWGAWGFVAFLAPKRLGATLAMRLRTATLVSLATLTLAKLALLPIKTAVIDGDWLSAVDTQTIQTVLLHTRVGEAWLVQALALVPLVAIACLSPKRRAPGLALASALFLATLALSGHAAMNTGLAGLLHPANHVLHLLSAGWWLGALYPVILLLARMQDAEHGTEARRALMRFSTVGHIAVALTILTGALNMQLILGGLPFDWSFPYQQALSLKIALVGLMVVMALVNRYRFVPRLARKPEAATRALLRGSVAEILLGGLVLALVAWFGTLEPL